MRRRWMATEELCAQPAEYSTDGDQRGGAGEKAVQAGAAAIQGDQFADRGGQQKAANADQQGGEEPARVRLAAPK